MTQVRDPRNIAQMDEQISANAEAVAKAERAAAESIDRSVRNAGALADLKRENVTQREALERAVGEIRRLERALGRFALMIGGTWKQRRAERKRLRSAFRKAAAAEAKRDAEA